MQFSELLRQFLSSFTINLNKSVEALEIENFIRKYSRFVVQEINSFHSLQNDLVFQCGFQNNARE